MKTRVDPALKQVCVINKFSNEPVAATRVMGGYGTFAFSWRLNPRRNLRLSHTPSFPYKKMRRLDRLRPPHKTDIVVVSVNIRFWVKLIRLKDEAGSRAADFTVMPSVIESEPKLNRPGFNLPWA